MRTVVNVGIGIWYPKGSMRLNDSLVKVGFQGKRQIYSGYLPDQCPPHHQRNYSMKAFALRDAVEAGATSILWCDSSVYAIASIDRIFETIEQDGYYFIDNGNNCAQTATDNALKNMNLSRDEAEKIPERTTCVFGFSMLHEPGRAFYHEFIHQESIGSFNGGREYRKEDSEDPRFWFSRHDQTAASIIAHQQGMTKMHHYGQDVMYMIDNGRRNEIPAGVSLINHGML